METAVLNKAAIIAALRSNSDTLRQYGVQQIGLFGSFVRDEAKESSDVDLLIQFSAGKKTFHNFMNLAFYLEDLFHRKVELVTPESLSPYIGPHIIKSVAYVPLAD